MVVYSHAESPLRQKASDEAKVAIWELDFPELEQEPVVPDTIKGLLHI